MPASPDLSFETPRIRARLLCEDDLDLYLALYTDPDVMRYVGETMSRERAMNAFAKVLRLNADPAVGARYWRLVHRRTGAALGLASLVRDFASRERAELGMMLLPASQRTGTGFQALHAILRGIFAPPWGLGISELVTRHDARNTGANRLAEYLGFEREASTGHDLVLLRMTAIQWEVALALREDRHHS